MPRKRNVHITAIERSEPNVRLYVLALIELARQLQNEAEQSAQGSGTDEEGEAQHD